MSEVVIEGYASLWGQADLNGDVTARGAFVDSLRKSGAGGIPMLPLIVRLEGRAPRSLSAGAVLAGANTLAIASADGWELASFRQATPLGDDVWRLSGLLRGLQGTEAEARDVVEAGAVVVMLDDALVRLDVGRDERDLPLLFRAGPAGAPPGGSSFASLTTTVRGVADRPWSPTQLRSTPQTGGLRIGWAARRRLFGDGWESDRELDASLRFRIRIMDGATERRTVEVESLDWIYALGDLEADFPAGTAAAVVRVGQWGEAWGWGPEAALSLAD